MNNRYTDYTSWQDEADAIGLHEELRKECTQEFLEEVSQHVAERARMLARKEIEPSSHPFFPKKEQEAYYFTHLNADGEKVDVRGITPEYARNLYSFYRKTFATDESLFMKVLKSVSGEEDD